MSWVRIDDGFTDHPKIVRVGPLATILYLRALCYSARHLTDGRVPAEIAEQLCGGLAAPRRATATPRALIGLLIRERLWEKKGDDFLIHDYLLYQPSKQEALDNQEQARRIRQLGGQARASQATRDHGRFAAKSGPADQQKLQQKRQQPAGRAADYVQPAENQHHPIPSHPMKEKTPKRRSSRDGNGFELAGDIVEDSPIMQKLRDRMAGGT
jgi:hypothetical protein